MIGIAPNLFYGTNISVCILIFKAKREENQNNICFIDASKLFTKGKGSKKKNILEPEHIDKIVKAYQERKEIPKFCHIAPISEIVENDYNLNIPRYVDTYEPEPPIDLNEVMREMEQTEKDIHKAVQDLAPYLKDLGLHIPGM